MASPPARRFVLTIWQGAENPVFFKQNTDMLLGDAKKTLEEIRNKLSE